MKISRGIRNVVAILVVIALTGLLVWGLLEMREGDKDAEAPTKPASRVAVQDGEVVTSLDAETQQKIGLEVVALTPSIRQQETKGFGTVLDLAPLNDSLAALTQSRAQVEKSSATLTASRAEYERLRILNADNKNASDKAVQAAQSTMRNDEASARAARESHQVLEAAAYQRWGSVIGRWIIQSRESLAPFLRQQEALLQVALPTSGASASVPATLRIPLQGGRFARARLISPAPRVDPRVQGITAFYRAPSEFGLMPGSNVAVFAPEGASVRGVTVPLSTIVWWQGRAWAYSERDAAHFVRREVPTDIPLEGAYFVPESYRVGPRVVVRGAQLLLSEEFRSQIQVGEEGAGR